MLFVKIIPEKNWGLGLGGLVIWFWMVGFI